MTIEALKACIRDIPDFPEPGIVFKDITPLLADPDTFSIAVRMLSECAKLRGAEEIVAIDARGFIFGAAVAGRLDLPLQLARKPGKLPYKTIGVDYALEYGTDRIEMHADAIHAGRHYVVIDDLLATGGTAGAVCELIEQQNGVVAGCAFVIELGFLHGVKRLTPRAVDSLITY